MTRNAKPKFRIYRDFKGDFIWGLYNSRGELIAEAPEGQAQKARCAKDIGIVKEAMLEAVEIEIDK